MSFLRERHRLKSGHDGRWGGAGGYPRLPSLFPARALPDHDGGGGDSGLWVAENFDGEAGGPFGMRASVCYKPRTDLEGV